MTRVIKLNIPAINLTDGYKLDHRRQYPKNTVKVYANFTPRKSRVKGVDYIVFFGLTYFIKDILLKEFSETFFNLPKREVVSKYTRRVTYYLGPQHGITFEHIEALHDLGYMPIRIKALPEGSLVKCGVPVLTITNTLPEFFWLPNFLETIISSELWGMSTSATTAFNYRVLFDSFAMDTVGNTDFSSTFQGHDFSARGLYGRHAAAMSGAAHLLSFRGTDTMFAIDFLEGYYGADATQELIGMSVPATEHSVMSMGMRDGELETFRRLITETYPKGIVSIVSDTWNLWDVIDPKEGILVKLKDVIMARDGKVVIRPDSGDPERILAGYDICEDLDEIQQILREEKQAVLESGVDFILYTLDQKAWDDHCMEYGKDSSDDAWYEEFDSFVDSKTICYAEVYGVVHCLYEIFGGTTNGKGYIELDPHIGTIYGDSITTERAIAICNRLKADGFASTNWVAGIGSFTYQYQTRDTYGWAMKATYGELAVQTEQSLNDYEIEPREIFKDPITDNGVKKSARGLLQVTLKDGEYVLRDQVSKKEEEQGELITVFEDGELLVDPTLTEIRGRIDNQVKHNLLPVEELQF